MTGAAIRLGLVLLLFTAISQRMFAETVSADESTAAVSSADHAISSGAEPAASSATSANVTLLLEVFINGQATGKIGEFTLLHGMLMSSARELNDLGFRVYSAAGGGDLIALSDLVESWKIDEKNQLLFVTISENGLLPTVLSPIGREGTEDRRIIESGTGLTFNYDFINTLAGKRFGATGSMDMRAFSPLGVLSSEWLAYAGATTNGSGKNGSIRLDSAYSIADVNSMCRYKLGDFITSGLAWTRPVHLGGVQIRSDFSMRPDLVTFPLPTITGSAAVPSTLSVLADGNLVVSNQIEAGPFEVPQLPVISGAGTISVTMTNALGQQTTMTQAFYASSALLAPRLQTFSVQTGLVRRNWGRANFDYGKPAGSALIRRGLTRKLTVEGAAEGAPGTFMAGAGAIAQIGNLGVINVSAAGSLGANDHGTQISLGAQRIGRTFSLGGSGLIATRNYKDVASMNGSGTLRRQISAFSSVSFRRLGSAGIAYGGIDQNPSVPTIQKDAVTGHRAQIISANYSVQVHRMAVYMTEFKDLTGGKANGGFQVGVSIPFGRRSSVDLSARPDGNAQIEIRKSAAQVGDWGYRIYASNGSSNHEFAEIQHKSAVGFVSVGADNTGGETILRVESRGALSFVDRALFPSNTIYDSFAVVDTGPMQNVRVMQENRDVGKTNSSGRLLVPDLRAFDLNHITIEPTDIPADVTVSNATREMRPQDRSGVVVRFPIKISHGALLQLVDESGIPIALGSNVTLQSTGGTYPIGYDGQAYVEDLSAHNKISIERSDGRRCRVEFDFQSSAGNIPLIGPLICREEE